MLNKLGHFFREYYQFGWVIVFIVLAIGFAVAGLGSVANIILATAAIINVIPLTWGMIKDLRSGTYGVDVLAATAIITSVVLGEYWAGMIIVLMLTGGEALEDYAANRAKSELSTLLDSAPKKAHLVKGKKIVDITASAVKVGDKLIVKPGEVVPVDGIIIEGESSFDESSLTGESLPIDRGIDDQVLSGSINTEGLVTIRAVHTASDSQYEQIIKLVKAASTAQSPFVRLADRYSIPFTAVAFIIAGGAWLVSGDSMRFLQVLVVATPCPLILGAPIALVSGISRAARHGIIIKNGGGIEQLSEVQTIGFDKTGTLTVGKPTVKSVVAYGKNKKDDVLALMAAIEQGSSHVLANAVIGAATKKKLRLPKVKNIKEIPGHGLKAISNGQEVLVGKYKLMNEQGVELPKNLKQNTLSQTTSFVAVNGTLIGLVTFEDAIRPESKTMLSRLKQLGIKDTLMVTGDNKATAQAIAKKLGIRTVVADAMPGDKLTAMEAVDKRPVAFVGDGVNDAPVLTAADVGIALGARGSTAASETADVVIMADDISKVAQSIDISKNTLRIAKQSIMIGIVISIVLMLIYSTGRFSAVSGAAIQELVDIIVIVYALRAHGPWRKRPQFRKTS